MSRRRRRDPLQRQADLLLQASLQPQRQSIRRAQAEARRQAEEDALTIQGFTKALAGLLTPAGAAVDKTYSDAATRQQRVAQGYSMGQQLAEKGAASQANALLAQQGAAPRIQAGPGSSVTYALGGIGPASTFNRAGAAFSSAAHNLPGMAAGRGQEQLASRLSESQKEQARFRAQMEDLMARVPGLRQQILDHLYSQETARQAAQTQADYLGVSQYNAQTGRLSQQATAANYQADNAASGGKSKQKARETRYGALDNTREKSYNEAVKLYEGKEVLGPSGVPKTVRATYTEAYNNLWSRFGAPILRYAPPGQRAWWKRQVMAVIVNSLVSAGYPKQAKRKKNKKKFGNTAGAG